MVLNFWKVARALLAGSFVSVVFLVVLGRCVVRIVALDCCLLLLFLYFWRNSGGVLGGLLVVFGGLQFFSCISFVGGGECGRQGFW